MRPVTGSTSANRLLGLHICPRRPITTPASLRRRSIIGRLSHYNLLYDIQTEFSKRGAVIPESAHHLVHGAANALGPLYFATFCALSVTLGALFYNLTGVLNEYFALQQQLTTKPKEHALLHGVDVSRSRMFQQPRILAATEFAAKAHAGQTRKTGEPYVSHCIETALIVEQNLPHWRQDSRHETAVIAALLHDVLDDTPTTPEQLTAAFGPAVSAMVVKVSKLSQVNQMLRRDKRKGVVSGDASYWAAQWSRLKRMMFEAVVEEPLVILVKLADRLHNMRTVFVLHPAKQQAVAEETLAVWCSMAASLGWHRLKSEMEDLCFAVTDLALYCSLRQQLDKIWSSPPPARSRRRVANSRRQRQLQQLAAQQQQLAAARAVMWEDMGQSLRDLKGLLGLRGAEQRRKEQMLLRHQQQQRQELVAYCEADGARSSSAPGAHFLLGKHQGGRPPWMPLLQQLLRTAGAPLLPAPSGHLEHDTLVDSSATSSASCSSHGVQADVSQLLLQQAPGTDWAAASGAFSSDTLLSRTSVFAVHLQQQQQPSFSGPAASAADVATSKHQELSVQDLTPQQQQLRNVLSTVVPFDAVDLKGSQGLTWSAKQGLKVLEEAAERLYNELAVGSFSSGLDVDIQGRLKSVRSIHNKMTRKTCGLEEVYDARALRVVVDDGGGTRLADAVQCCYRLVAAVHKLWHPIHGEFDDYIANPKPSGYQALHTAVWGPGGAALEVQIKTSGMHEHAEYGGAAHWAYKEVLWGSAGAAVAAVNSIGAGSSIMEESCLAGLSDGGCPAAAGSGASRTEVVSLPAVTFSFDDEGRLLKSTAGNSVGTSFSTAATFDRRQQEEVAVVAVAAQNSTFRNEAAMGASMGGNNSTSGSSSGSSTAVAVAERPQSMLERIANYSKQQQRQASDGNDQLSETRAAQPSGLLFRPGGGSSSSSGGSYSTVPPDGVGRWRQQQQQQQPSEWQRQQQQQLRAPPKAYVGQPVLRVSNKLRYGVVLAVCENNRSGRAGSGSSSSSPLVPAAAAGGAASAGRHLTVQDLSLPGFTSSSRTSSRTSSSSSSVDVCGSSGSSAATGGSSVSLLCVIMSGGTNPDHPWRMPDYCFYQHLFDYATESGWGRPGQSDLHARIEEFEFCRDGRWHRRDHLGYLHPHTTLTLLDGYERDASAAAAHAASTAAAAAHQQEQSGTAAAAGSAAAGAVQPDPTLLARTTAATAGGSSSSNAEQLIPGKKRGRSGKSNSAMLLRSWATGGGRVQQDDPTAPAAPVASLTAAAAAGGASTSRQHVASSKPLNLETSTSPLRAMQKQQQQQTTTSSTSSSGGKGVDGDSSSSSNKSSATDDWAATAAKAAQLRSVVEWGLEAYGVRVAQQSNEVYVVIWPGGGIEEVPRGTTAGQILREKGVLAILDSSSSSSSSSSGEEGFPGAGAATSPTDRQPALADIAMTGGTAVLINAPVQQRQQQQQQRLVNVNNRLVGEDTVLSDGDLVILAREIIKI